MNATMNATRNATMNATMNATRDATMDATMNATSDATMNAAWNATGVATRAATMDATIDATSDATSDATRKATVSEIWDTARNATVSEIWDKTKDKTMAETWDVTGVATRNATRDATEDAIWKTATNLSKWYVHNNSFLTFITKIKKISKSNEIDIFLKNVYFLWSGGNMWGQVTSFITFFRYIAKLNIDYSKFDAYEKLSIHSGPRFMHKKFCIISDKPLFIKRDEQHRPHCETGPYIKWSDESALYAIHGTRVPAWIIEKPLEITVEKIEKEENLEVKRIMIDKYGIGKYIEDSRAVLIHKDKFGELYEKIIINDEPIKLVKVINSTPESNGSKKIYWLRVPPYIQTAEEAVSWTFGLNPKEYKPKIET
jgi:hypothetical protein